MANKKCFMDTERPCDLTCKAAFEVDDPVDNVDCYFIWLAYHFGEGLFEMKRAMEGFNIGSGFPMPGSGGFGPGGPGPGATPPGGPSGGPMGGHGPKNFPKN